MGDNYIKVKCLCIIATSQHQKEDIRKIFNFFSGNYSLDRGLGILIPPSWDIIYIETTTDKHIRLARGMKTLKTWCALSEVPIRVTIHGLEDFVDNYCLNWIENPDDVCLAKFWGYITVQIVKTTLSVNKLSAKNKKVCDSLLQRGACKTILAGEANISQLGNLMRVEEELRYEENMKARILLDVPRGQYKIFSNCLDYGPIRLYSYAFDHSEFSDDGADGKIAKFSKKIDVTGVEYNIFSEEYTKIMVKKKHLYIYSPSSNRGKTRMLQQLLMECNACEITDVNNFAGLESYCQYFVMDEYGHQNKFSFEALKKFTGGIASSFSGNVKSFGKSFTPRPDAQLVIFSNTHIFGLYGEWSPKLQRRFLNPLQAELLENRFHIIKVDPSQGSLEDDARSFIHPSNWSKEDLKGEIDILFTKYIGKRFLRLPSTDISKKYAGKVFLKKLQHLISIYNDGESPHRYIPFYAVSHLPACDIVNSRIHEDQEFYANINL